MSLQKQLFLLAAEVIRKLPKIRGKVRLGLYVYKKLNSPDEDFTVEAPLFRDKLKFCLNLNCAHERMAYLMGQYEEDTSDFLVEVYCGNIFLDIGANIGLVSLPFAERTKNSFHSSQTKPHVYAVEALRSNYESLCRNVQVNNLQDYIKPINAGLGARTNQVFIQIEGDNPSRTGTANILPSDFEFCKIALRVHSIDELISDRDIPANISLIKLDTDGYDFEILKGAKNLLINRRTIVFAELNEHCLNWHGYGIKQVVEYLTPLGYEVWTKQRGHPLKFSRYSPSRKYISDCLLVPVEEADRFSKYLVAHQ